MNTEILGVVVQIALMVILAYPLGKYIAKVYRGEKTWSDFMAPIERVIYKVCGIDPNEEMNWKQFLKALLILNAFWFFWGMVLLVSQGWLPLNPDGNGPQTPDQAFNTCISFMVNCNLQHYSGESGLTYFTQLFVIMLFQFITAATGMAAMAGIMKSIAAKTTKTIGNFWQFLVISCTRILLPLSLIVGFILILQGTPMGFDGKMKVTTMEGQEQMVSQGPTAAIVPIKQLGTNGGGYFGVNSSHPLENPTYLTNMVECWSILIIPMAMVLALGFYTRRKKLAYSIFGVMLFAFLVGVCINVSQEMGGNPRIDELGIAQDNGTMEGRIQKAREGKWNGGFAPYGYKLEKGMLYINEEEAEAIRIIFDQYVHTDIGANGLAKYLANHGINKIQRQNGKNPLFDAALIRRILKNPVYCGKIAYGRRRTEKVHGTRNDYRLVEQENYLLVDGLHEAIVSEGLWHEAQVKLLAQAKKYEKVNNGKDNKVHLLTGLLKCPICGAGMYGNKSIKHKPDGTKYKDFFYYGCKHRTMTRGHKCEYKKQINEELLDGAVAEVIIKLVSNPKFAAMMQQKINMKIDTSAIEQEIANYEKQLRQSYATKSRLIDEIDTLDPDDKHYIKRKADLDDRLYKMYDKIEDTENLLIEARAKKMAIEAEKLTADNIYKVLIYFEKLYAVMDEQEKRQIMESLISEIHIYEERQPNGQWLKSIKFKLPIIEEDMEMSLDSDTHVEVVGSLVRVK